MQEKQVQISGDVLNHLGRTRRQCILEELLANSAHFPIANLIYEFFLSHGLDVFLKFETYALILGAIVQAIVLGTWRFEGKNRLLIGNLIGPIVYLTIEFFLEGAETFESVNHIAYFIFALLIGCIQWLQAILPALQRTLLVLEAITRTSIVVVMYALFEVSHGKGPLSGFFDDQAHRFITASILFLGLLLGIANVSARHYLILLRQTASRLKDISHWSWGESLVSSALADPTSLERRRVERIIIFLDIRGFTSWSENNSPEDVVKMVNHTFENLEDVWTDQPVIRAKHTGDELMLILESDCAVQQLCLDLLEKAEESLKPYALHVGIGAHIGLVIEGLMGSRSIQGYDVLGDNVNTAARLCSNAHKGECLISAQIAEKINLSDAFETREVQAKGKNDPLKTYVLRTQ